MEELIRLIHRMRMACRNLQAFDGLHPGAFFTLAAIGCCLEGPDPQGRPEMPGQPEASGKGEAGEGTEKPGITVTQLAHRLSISNPAASKMLRGLEEKGYIRRLPDPEDRRITYIALSPEGSQILDRARRQADQLADNLVSRMGKEEMEELLRLCRKLADLMEEDTV